jgi:hypothetical protein
LFSRIKDQNHWNALLLRTYITYFIKQNFHYCGNHQVNPANWIHKPEKLNVLYAYHTNPPVSDHVYKGATKRSCLHSLINQHFKCLREIHNSMHTMCLLLFLSIFTAYKTCICCEKFQKLQLIHCLTLESYPWKL